MMDKKTLMITITAIIAFGVMLGCILALPDDTNIGADANEEYDDVIVVNEYNYDHRRDIYLKEGQTVKIQHSKKGDVFYGVEMTTFIPPGLTSVTVTDRVIEIQGTLTTQGEYKIYIIGTNDEWGYFWMLHVMPSMEIEYKINPSDFTETETKTINVYVGQSIAIRQIENIDDNGNPYMVGIHHKTIQGIEFYENNFYEGGVQHFIRCMSGTPTSPGTYKIDLFPSYAVGIYGEIILVVKNPVATFIAPDGTPYSTTVEGPTVTAPTVSRPHYNLSYWGVMGSGEYICGDRGTFTIEEDMTLYAYWTPVESSIVIRADTGGSVSASSYSAYYDDTYVISGNKITLPGSFEVTATADAGYTFSRWLVNGAEKSGSGTLVENVVFEAVFEKTPYTLTFTATTGGNVDKTTVTAHYGDSYVINGNVFGIGSTQIRASESMGYDFARWVKDGSTATSGTVTGNTTFTAEFELEKYRIDFEYDNRYTDIDKRYIDNVPYGTEYTANGDTITFKNVTDGTVTFTITKPGYEAKWIDKSSGGEVTSGTIIEAKTFVVQAREHLYTIKLQSTEGGSCNIEEGTVTYGTEYYVYDSQYLKIGASYIGYETDEGYNFVGWFVNGEQITTEHRTITEDITIECRFERIISNLTFKVEGGHGELTRYKLDDVPYNTTWSVENNNLVVGGITIYPVDVDFGYEAKWYLNGTEATSGKVQGSMDFTVMFTITKWTVSFSVDGNGGHLEIDGDTSKTAIQYIEWGTEIIIENDGSMTIGKHRIVPISDRGYVFSEFSVKSGSITADREITAKFVKSDDFVTVTIKSDGNGMVSVNGKYEESITLQIPKGMSAYVQGGILTIENIEYRILADNGYVFDYWQSPKNLDNDVTIIGHCIIESNPEAVSVEQTEGGKVTIVQYNEQATVTKYSRITVDGNTITIGTFVFTADANSDYRFVKWCYRNGEEIKDGDQVTGTLTIHAEYKKEYYIVTFSTNDVNGGAVQIEGGHVTIKVKDGSIIEIDGNVIRIDGQTVTATANDGYKFTEWIGIKNGDKVESDMNVTANFESGEPAPEPENNDRNMAFLIGAIVCGVIAIALVGAIIYGYNHPLFYILTAVAAVVAIVSTILYVMDFKL